VRIRLVLVTGGWSWTIISRFGRQQIFFLPEHDYYPGCQNAAYGDLCSRQVQMFGRCKGCLLQSLWMLTSLPHWGPCWTGPGLQGGPTCAAGTMFPFALVHLVIPPPYCSVISSHWLWGGNRRAGSSVQTTGGKSHLWKCRSLVLCS